MEISMGLQFGLENPNRCLARKFRWLFTIKDVSGDVSSVNSLPPSKSSRPQLSFKEIEAIHVTETIYFPGRPEWKPINLTLYDTNTKNGVFTWIQSLYKVPNNYNLLEEYNSGTSESIWSPSVAPANLNAFKRSASLVMLSGCGEVIETWIFDNAWPQSINYGELEMGNSDLMYIDLNLRYDRAYVIAA